VTGCASRRPARWASAALGPVGVEAAIMAKITSNGAIPVTALIAEAQREFDLRRQFYWSRLGGRQNAPGRGRQAHCPHGSGRETTDKEPQADSQPLLSVCRRFIWPQYRH
jgi:hypothetical protein